MPVFDVKKQGPFAELHAKVPHDTHLVGGDAPFELCYDYPVEVRGYLSDATAASCSRATRR